MSVPTLKYLEPSEVVSLLADAETKESTAIVDVRDGDEYASGHITGASNLSSEKWQDPSFVDAAIQNNLDKKTVVFHCMLSQKRGPTCARIFSQRLSELNYDKPLPEVVVLTGGFDRFSREYQGRSDLIKEEDDA